MKASKLITIRGISVAIEKRGGMFRAYEIVSSSERYLVGISRSREHVISIATRSLSDVDKMLASGTNAQIRAKKNILKRVVDNHFPQALQ